MNLNYMVETRSKGELGGQTQSMSFSGMGKLEYIIPSQVAHGGCLPDQKTIFYDAVLEIHVQICALL